MTLRNLYKVVWDSVAGQLKALKDDQYKADIDNTKNYEDINVGSEEGGSSLLSATVELTDAQIKALPTTPVELVAAQSGKIFLPVSGMVVINSTAGAYTNMSDSSLYIDINGYNLLSTGSSSGLEEVEGIYMNNLIQNYSGAAGNGMNNVAMKLVSNNGGNFTGGNAANTLKVTVYYVVVDL